MMMTMDDDDDFKFPNGLFWLDVRSVGQAGREGERAQVYETEESWNI